MSLFKLFQVIIIVIAVVIGSIVFKIDSYSKSEWFEGQSKFTDNVPTYSYELSTGESIELPILYHPDNTCVGLFYHVDQASANQVIAENGLGDDLECMPISGYCVAILVFFEYRDTAIGTYNEVGLGIQTRRKGSDASWLNYLVDLREDDNQALLVVNLPVTTEAAYFGGTSVWGYPKYVAKIDADIQDSGTTFTLGDEFKTYIPTPQGPELGAIPFVTFSVKSSKLVRTVINVGHNAKYGPGSGVETSALDNGVNTNPTVRTMRALGLLDKKPVFVWRTDKMTSRLGQGYNVAQLQGEGPWKKGTVLPFGHTVSQTKKTVSAKAETPKKLTPPSPTTKKEPSTEKKSTPPKPETKNEKKSTPSKPNTKKETASEKKNNVRKGSEKNKATPKP